MGHSCDKMAFQATSPKLGVRKLDPKVSFSVRKYDEKLKLT